MITTLFNLSYVNSLECISMDNQECKARPKIIDVNNNEINEIKEIIAAEVVAISMTHTLNYVFQISLKT